MPKGRYYSIREEGITFIFKYDVDAPNILHIYARHTTEPDDALDVFFDRSASQTRNHEFDRYERYSRTHGLFWFWLEESRVVMVITCFRREDDHGETS